MYWFLYDRNLRHKRDKNVVSKNSFSPITEIELNKSFFRNRVSIFQKQGLSIFNPFSTNVPYLYPLKTSENRRFSDIFRGYRSGTLVENGLKTMSFNLTRVTRSSLFSFQNPKEVNFIFTSVFLFT